MMTGINLVDILVLNTEKILSSFKKSTCTKHMCEFRDYSS